MSAGRKPDKITIGGDYQQNLAKIAEAELYINELKAMNEEAKKRDQMQRELMEKIAEGERAQWVLCNIIRPSNLIETPQTNVGILAT